MDVLIKKCTGCKLELDKSNFNKCSSKKDGLQSYCKSCKKKSARKRYKDNPEDFLRKQREYREKKKEEIALKRKKYTKHNKNKLLEKQREYEYNRYHNDLKYRITKNIRSRTYSAFKAKGINKNTKTLDMLGCTKQELIKHIESQFKQGMSWDNKSEWHIDHIIPLSSAKNENELIKLSHYKNLQPLWEIENKIKSNKI